MQARRYVVGVGALTRIIKRSPRAHIAAAYFVPLRSLLIANKIRRRIERGGKNHDRGESRT